MLYSLGTIKAVNRNDRFTSTPAVRPSTFYFDTAPSPSAPIAN